jgi:hypothetical protein
MREDKQENKVQKQADGKIKPKSWAVLATNLGLPLTIAEALPKETLFIARPPA